MMTESIKYILKYGILLYKEQVSQSLLDPNWHNLKKLLGVILKMIRRLVSLSIGWGILLKLCLFVSGMSCWIWIDLCLFLSENSWSRLQSYAPLHADSVHSLSVPALVLCTGETVPHTHSLHLPGAHLNSPT